MAQGTLKNYRHESRLFATRSIVIFALVLLFFIAIVGRLFYLQVIKKNTYATLSMNNLLKVIPIPANRGLIYDRNGVLLAKNTPVFSLVVVPGDIKNLKATVAGLSKILTLDPADLAHFKHALKEHRRYEPVPPQTKTHRKRN